MATLAVWTRLTDRTPALVAAVSGTICDLLHLTFHAGMLHMYGTHDNVLNMIMLGTAELCSAVLIIPTINRKQEQP